LRAAMKAENPAFGRDHLARDLDFSLLGKLELCNLRRSAEGDSMETRISPSRGGEMFLPHYARYREACRGRRLNGALRRYVRQSAERATKSEPTLPVARCRALSANTNCAMLPKTSRREREREREISAPLFRPRRERRGRAGEVIRAGGGGNFPGNA